MMEALPTTAEPEPLARGSLPSTLPAPRREASAASLTTPHRMHEPRPDDALTADELEARYPLFRRQRDPGAPLRPPGVTPQDADWYPLREDLSEVEGPLHARITSYFHEALPIVQPTCGVERAVGVYLNEGDDETCLEADILVTAQPYAHPKKQEQVIRAWLVDRFLFACDVVSGSNTQAAMERKQETYEQRLQVAEYLEIDPRRRRMVLYRRAGAEYTPVEADAAGRLWSQALGVGFEMDDTGFVWLLKPDGNRILRHQADHARAEAAARRAEAEHQRAETEKARAEAALEQLARLEARLAQLLGEALDQPTADHPLETPDPAASP